MEEQNERQMLDSPGEEDRESWIPVNPEKLKTKDDARHVLQESEELSLSLHHAGSSDCRWMEGEQDPSAFPTEHSELEQPASSCKEKLPEGRISSAQKRDVNYHVTDDKSMICQVPSKRRPTSPLLGKKSKLLRHSLRPNENVYNSSDGTTSQTQYNKFSAKQACDETDFNKEQLLNLPSEHISSKAIPKLLPVTQVSPPFPDVSQQKDNTSQASDLATQHKDSTSQEVGNGSHPKSSGPKVTDQISQGNNDIHQELNLAAQHRDIIPEDPGNDSNPIDTRQHEICPLSHPNNTTAHPMLLLPRQELSQTDIVSVPVKHLPQEVLCESPTHDTESKAHKDFPLLTRGQSPNGIDKTGKSSGDSDNKEHLNQVNVAYKSVSPSTSSHPQSLTSRKDESQASRGSKSTRISHMVVEMPLLVPKEEKLDDYTAPECNASNSVFKDVGDIYRNYNQSPSRSSSDVNASSETVNSSAGIVCNENIHLDSESPQGDVYCDRDKMYAPGISSKESHFSNISSSTLGSESNHIFEGRKVNDFVHQSSRKSTKAIHRVGCSSNIGNSFDSAPFILESVVQSFSGESSTDNARTSVNSESNVLEICDDKDPVLVTNYSSQRRPDTSQDTKTIKNTFNGEGTRVGNQMPSKENVDLLLYVKCGICSQLFNSIRELQRHMTVHDLKRPYRCNYCSNAYSYIKELQVHIDSHSVDLPYICSVCEEVFAQAEMLSKHLTESHTLEMSSCELESDVVLENLKKKIAVGKKSDIQEGDWVEPSRGGFLERIPSKISCQISNPTKIDGNFSAALNKNVQMLKKTGLFSSFVPLPQLDISRLSNSVMNVSKAATMPPVRKRGRPPLKRIGSLPQRDTAGSQSARSNLLSVRSKKTLLWSKKYRFGGGRRGRKPKSLTMGDSDEKSRYSICEFCCEVHADISHHRSTHTQTELKKCGQCGLSLATRASAVRHFLVCHKRVKLLTCKLCDVFVGSETKYIKHFLVLHASCSGSKIESDWLMIDDDSETEHRHKPSELSICETCCEVVTKIKRHYRVHTEKELLLCGFCDLKLASKGSVARHFSNVHKSRGEIPCRVCREVFKSETKYKEHFLKEHPTAKSSKLNVDFDPEESENEEMDVSLSLQDLSNISDLISADIRRSSLPCVCPFCCGVFPYLKRHQLRHDKEMLTRCGFCKMILATKNSVIRHYNAIHKAQENLQCKKCKRFIGSEDKYLEHYDECRMDESSTWSINRTENGDDAGNVDEDDDIEYAEVETKDSRSADAKKKEEGEAFTKSNTSSRNRKSKPKSADPSTITNKDDSLTNENQDLDSPHYSWCSVESEESGVEDAAVDKIRKSAKPCICPFCCGVFPYLKQHQFQHEAEVLTQCGFCKLILATKNSVIRHYNAVHRAHKNLSCEKCELFVGSERKYMEHFEQFHHKMNERQDGMEDALSLDVGADEDGSEEPDDKELVDVSAHISQDSPPKDSNLEHADEVSVNFGSEGQSSLQQTHDANYSTNKTEDAKSGPQGRQSKLQGETSTGVHEPGSNSSSDDDEMSRSSLKEDGDGDRVGSSIHDVEESGSGPSKGNIRTELDEFIDKMSVCEICCQVPYNLKKHRHDEHVDVANKCGFCDKTFTTRFQIIQHFKRIHKKLKNLYCPVCQKFVGSEELYKRHYLKLHDSQFLDSIGFDKFPEDTCGDNEKVSHCIVRREHSSVQANHSASEKESASSEEGNNISNSSSFITKNSKKTSTSEEKHVNKIKKPRTKSTNDAKQSSHKRDPAKKSKIFYINYLKTDPSEKDIISTAFKKSNPSKVDSRMSSLYSLTICRVCSEVHWNIKVHNRKHVGKQPKCGFCQNQISRKSLEGHYRSVHLKKGDLSCPICCKPYFTEEAYIKHFLNEHKSVCFENLEDFKKNKRQICEICCELHIDLKGHRNVHPSPAQTICGFCGQSLATRGSLSRHYLTNHKMRQNLNCKFCDTFIGSEEKYIRHYKSEHENHNGHGVASDSDQEPTASYECEFCDKKFMTAALLKSHVTCHEEKAIACDICSHVCYGQNQFTKHQATEHGIQIPEKCYICMEYLPNHKKLLAHINEHRKETDGNGYMCKFCGKTFRLIQSLGQHVKRFHDANPKFKFECKTCKKGFDSKSFLKSHMRKHSGERPFMCEFCGSGFRVKVSLQMHLNRHTGNRPYKCDQCSKSFKQLSTLQTHQRQHTGSKPYMCQDCGKCFSDRSNFFSHRRSNHKIAPETKSAVSGLSSYNIGSAFAGFNPLQKF